MLTRDGLRLAAAAAIVLTLTGCGVLGQESRRRGYESFYRGDFESALTILDEAADDKNRLLYAWDRGMIHHLRGEYELSNAALAESESIMEELLTTDISDVAASFLINDYSRAYDGEDFEKVLVHPIKAINYLALGEPDAALVECRALNERLVELHEKYENRPVYHEDAFARYLSGIIYESEGNLNDALVDYRLAAEGYQDYLEAYGTPMPLALAQSILRVSEGNRIGAVYKEYRDLYPDLPYLSYLEKRKLGEFVLIFENGQAPLKVEEDFQLLIDEQLISFAFPAFRASPRFISHGRLRAGENEAITELCEDVTAIAIKDLQDRYGRVVAKGLGRAALKYFEVEKVKEKNEALGFLLNIFNSVNERADLRSWETLPGNFQISRLVVEPGSYEKLELDLYDMTGVPLETVDLGPWSVGPGETQFLFYRSLR